MHWVPFLTCSGLLLLQVEADIRPFRGLLIGLFFLSVGGSINMEVLKDNYDVILWMLAGLVSLKAAVNTMLGPLFGLSKSVDWKLVGLLWAGCCTIYVASTAV